MNPSRHADACVINLLAALVLMRREGVPAHIRDQILEDVEPLAHDAQGQAYYHPCDVLAAVKKFRSYAL